MEFAPHQVQIFVSLALILGVSLIALICDYLKDRNERLRELAVELTTEVRVRREESEKLVQLLTSRNSPSEDSELASPETFSSPFPHTTGPEHQRDLSRAEAPPVSEQAAWETDLSQHAVAPSAPKATQRKRIPPEALVAIVRAAIQAGAGKDSVNTPEPAPAVDSAASLAAPVEIPAPDAAQPQAALVSRKVSAKRDWNALLTAQRKEQAPFGMLTAPELQHLLDSGHKVSGLVVCIGLTSTNSVEITRELTAEARSGIESLLETDEFAGPTGESEFILICPQARGASAQRRLSRISRHLWDVQLGSLGQHGPQYSWGGLEVRDEPLKNAVESAQERMLQTRHSRNLVTLAGPASSLSFREAV